MSDSDVMSSASGMGVAASDLLTQIELQHERQRLLPAQPHAPTVTHASESQPQPQPQPQEGLSAPTGLSSLRQGIPVQYLFQYSLTTFAGNCGIRGTVQGGYYAQAVLNYHYRSVQAPPANLRNPTSMQSRTRLPTPRPRAGWYYSTLCTVECSLQPRIPQGSPEPYGSLRCVRRGAVGNDGCGYN